jgi:hypothetical protein
MNIGKTYDEADRQYFAGYVEHRAPFRPNDCHGGLDCWVEFGPPALTNKKPGGTSRGNYCLGCGGAPAIAYASNHRGGRYGRERRDGWHVVRTCPCHFGESVNFPCASREDAEIALRGMLRTSQTLGT